MSTLILDPVFSYFSIFLPKRRAAFQQAHKEAKAESSLSKTYLAIVGNILWGTLLFLVLLVPTVALEELSTGLLHAGIQNSVSETLLPLAAQAILAFDLLLYCSYCARVLYQAVRSI